MHLLVVQWYFDEEQVAVCFTVLLFPLCVCVFCRQQERIASERDEIDKNRRLLMKRKPPSLPKNPKQEHQFVKPGEK